MKKKNHISHFRRVFENDRLTDRMKIKKMSLQLTDSLSELGRRPWAQTYLSSIDTHFFISLSDKAAAPRQKKITDEIRAASACSRSQISFGELNLLLRFYDCLKIFFSTYWRHAYDIQTQPHDPRDRDEKQNIWPFFYIYKIKPKKKSLKT